MTGFYKLMRKAERKFGRFAISNLMLYIVSGMLMIYIAEMLTNSSDLKMPIESVLVFDRDAILHGQVWRLLTFIFVPPATGFLGPISLVFELYFFWLFGVTLERQWGTFRFNFFYLIGIVGTWIAGFISGYADNACLNMSLLLAFALLYPNYQVMLFFILPIKIKWLGIFDAVLTGIEFVLGGFSTKLAIIFSLANILLFFWTDISNFFKSKSRRIKRRAGRGGNSKPIARKDHITMTKGRNK